MNWLNIGGVSYMTRSDDKTNFTTALRTAMSTTRDRRVAEDFLYLESWERTPTPGPAAALRIQQIRRANPELAAAIRHEVGNKENDDAGRRVRHHGWI